MKNDETSQPSVLIISEDNSLVDSMLANAHDGQVFVARDSVQHILDKPDLLDGNGIVILDVSGEDVSNENAIDHVIKIKELDPTQIIIIVGEQETLPEVLNSEIQPIIYRAFPKPISANQVSLAFKSGHAAHADLLAKQARGEDIAFVSATEAGAAQAAATGAKTNNSIMFGAMALVALLAIGWLIFSGNDEEEPTTIIAESADQNLDELDEPIITISASAERIRLLNEEATKALNENRVISPAGDNALEYFDQVLAIDAYDTTAYEGKKQVAARLRTSYNQLVNNAEFDRALNVIGVLQQIDPLNVSNDQLRDNLELSIDSYVEQIQESGTSADIAKTAAVLQKMESKFEGSKSASEALKAERQLVAKIDAALDSGSLAPPKQDNAYALVSQALKSNSVSKANIQPRVTTLSNQLTGLATEALKEDKFEEVEKLSALIKRLNVAPEKLAKLNKDLASRKAAIEEARAKLAAKAPAQGTSPSNEAENAAPELPQIIDAKIVRRDPPRYPTRALNKGIEGWVEVSFMVDSSGEPFDVVVANSDPEGVFDSSAIRAVKKWRFTPARDRKTGKPVASTMLSNKLQFRLD